MDTLNSALGPIHMQPAVPEIDLAPSQGAKLSSPQAMPISEQDRRSISCAIPSPFTGRLDQSINFLLIPNL